MTPEPRNEAAEPCPVCGKPRHHWFHGTIPTPEPRNEAADDLRERLAEIEHDQWIEWSRTIAEQGLTPERIERWQRYWVPYADLDEPTKDHDRVWADKVLEALAAERAAPKALTALAATPEEQP